MATMLLPAQTVTLERVDHLFQTSAGTPGQIATPYSFEAHLRGGGVNMSGWGAAFYKPGTGNTPDSGASGSTNTGTLNFPAAPNNGALDYLFANHFADDTSLQAFYPTGSYGVLFNGSSPPSPASFTAGLAFNSNTYSAAAPQISEVDNGALWSGGLQVSTTGITTLTFNSGSFGEYGSGFGTIAGAGLYDSFGNVIASTNSFYIGSLGLTQSVITQLAVDGSLLTPGANYTLEIQYGILASAPGTATLDGTAFMGLSIYYNNTAVNLTAVPEPSSFAAGAGLFALGLAAWCRRRTVTS